MTAPAGLYVHVPYCSAICPYCDFAVTTGPPARHVQFVAALQREIESWRDFPSAFDTVYFGGGTPSILAGELFCELCEALREGFSLTPDVRVFLEANPEDVDAERCTVWKAQGVETLSLGVQSFDAAELRFLGRRHSPAEARKAVEVALAAGFATVSLDLIYGLPGQEVATWEAALEAVARLDVHHISAYQLTVAEGTPFGERRARGRFQEMEEGPQAQFFRVTHNALAERGFPAYEVSNFARSEEHRSRHNQKYWHHVPYLGLGPSAHSFHDARRWWNVRETPLYVARSGTGESCVAGSEDLTPTQLALEALLLGLRTVEGVDLDGFHERYGVDLLGVNSEVLERLSSRGLVTHQARRLALTVDGLAVADGLVAELSVE